MRNVIALLVCLIPINSNAVDLYQYGLGMASALVVHEAGHELADPSIEWHGTEWHCTSECNASRIAFSGFAAQAVGTEALAAYFDGLKYRDYRNGIRFFNIVQPALYALKNDDDLENFNSHDRRNMRFALILFSGYSLMKYEF